MKTGTCNKYLSTLIVLVYNNLSLITRVKWEEMKEQKSLEYE